MSKFCIYPGCMGIALTNRRCEHHRYYEEPKPQITEQLELPLGNPNSLHRKVSPNVRINIDKPEYDTKATNPKDAIGGKKLPLHLIPGSAKSVMALAFLEGALKYGKYNWRIAGVRASIYLDAMERHLEKFKNGENCDPDTGVPHLGSIMACAAIIIDASLCDQLNDDRPPEAPVSHHIDSLQTNVRHLQELFADHDPHQYTIEDTPDGLETEQG